MAQVKIILIAPNGVARKFDVQTTFTASNLIKRTKGQLGLADGDYALVYRSRQLSDSETLSMAEVGDGAELKLIATVSTKSSSLPNPNPLSNSSTADYVAEANAAFPQLIIYLIDVSGSMNGVIKTPAGERTRIQVAEENFRKALQTMNARSLKGDFIAPRYRIALYTYSDTIKDVYGGAKSIGEIMQIGIPNISANFRTNTKGAFEAAQKLLGTELPKLQDARTGSREFPAPLVCHLTDGEFSEDHGDPEPIVKEIMSLRVPDGRVLVENIYISDAPVTLPNDLHSWKGFTFSESFPNNSYAQKLLGMSSAVPASYAKTMLNSSGYQIEAGTALLYPGISTDLVKLAFQMSCATQVGR